MNTPTDQHSVAARLRETYAHEAAMTLLREAAAAPPNLADEWHGPIDGPLKVLARTEAEAQDVARLRLDGTMEAGWIGNLRCPFYLRKGSPIAMANGLENFLDT